MNTEEKYSFKEDISIDQYALDEEWRKQAELYAKWAEMHVEASYAYDRAKEKHDAVKAAAEREIRNDPALYGLKKDTEGAIQLAVSNNSEVKESFSDIIKAKKDMMILAVARDALEHKKYALAKLTDLFLAKYYVEPYASRESKRTAMMLGGEGRYSSLNESMDNQQD